MKLDSSPEVFSPLVAGNFKNAALLITTNNLYDPSFTKKLELIAIRFLPFVYHACFATAHL
jgi:hypothetical protein